MAIEFRKVQHGPLVDFSALAPDGAIIGIIGEKRAGKSALLRLAAGLETPHAGEVLAPAERRWLGLGDALNLSPVSILALDQALSQQDALVREQTAFGLERLRRAGTTVLLSTHESSLIERLCDEVWWLHEGWLTAQGDVRETLAKYKQHIAARVRAWGGTLNPPLDSSSRRGDHRAEIVSLETLGADGKPTTTWTSGEPVSIRVSLRFLESVCDPVIGIMIRTRIGLEVYGTNTELEKVRIGPCAVGDMVQVTFSFRCELCPGDYTLTAASHDPDGSAHDWLDDAVAFSIVDSRETAGIANLRAHVTVNRNVTSRRE
ncbi:MAG TPA: Wzt carbohydrate-binding domain-containing protein [Bryobacteraceae bacterium]|nr:Wzt carbohydrate-binding domain-containing protein [Bryobacteraceae bacterium]